jgi:ankyrin repeat protein
MGEWVSGKRRATMADLTKDMIRAVKKGDAPRVQELLALDATLLGLQEEDGSTPLHMAAWKGNAEVVALLLEAGAGVDAQSQNGHYGGTALHAAAHGNHKEVAELLIACGADVSATSCNGRTPLAETDVHKATAVAKLLKQHGAA